MARPQEVVFEQAVEGLLRNALRGKVTPALQERLLRLGVNVEGRLAPAYPRETWEQILIVAREEVFPDEPVEVGMRELGRLVVDGFAATLVGKALRSLVRVIGPMRTLERMTRNLRAAGNYNETRVTPRGPRACEILDQRGAHPPWLLRRPLRGHAAAVRASSPRSRSSRPTRSAPPTGCAGSQGPVASHGRAGSHPRRNKTRDERSAGLRCSNGAAEGQ